MATSMLLVPRRCDQMGCWLSSVSCSPSCCMCAITLAAPACVAARLPLWQLNVGYKGRMCKPAVRVLMI
jgi:hypothetical protein